MASRTVSIVLTGNNASAVKAIAGVETAAAKAGTGAATKMTSASQKIGGTFTRLDGLLAGFGLPFTGALGAVGAHLEQTETKAKTFGGALGSIGKGELLAAGAGLAIVGAEALHLADSFDQAHARLSTAVHNVGQSMSTEGESIKAADEKLVNLGFAATDTESSLATLTGATKSASKAAELEGLAADIARGRHIDLATATSILVKVETGHVGLLGRLGISTKDATGKTISQEEAVRRLTALYGGQAAAYLDTYAGKQAVLAAKADDVGVKLGTVEKQAIEHVADAAYTGVTAFQHFNSELGGVPGKLLAVAVAAPALFTVGSKIVGAFTKLGEGVGRAVQGIGRLTGATGEAVAAEEAATVATTDLAGADAVAAGTTTDLAAAQVVEAESATASTAAIGAKVGIYAVAAVAAVALGKTLYDLGAVSTKASLNISGSASKLADSIFHGVASANEAKLALNGLTGATEKWFKAQGAAAEQTGGTLIKNLGLSYQDVTDAVVAGIPSINEYVKAQHLSEVNAGTLRNGLVKLHDALDASSEAKLRDLQATGALNPKLAEMAIKMSTAKDGTVDWIGALDLVANKQDDVARTSGNLLLTLDTQRQKWNDLTQAVRDNTDRLRDNRDGLLGLQGQAISAEQNLFRIADAQKKYNDAVKKSGKFSAEAIQAGLEYQAVTNSQAQSVDSAAVSAEKAAADQSGLTAALKVQQDAIKKNDPAAIARANDLVAAKTEVYRSVLTKYAATVAGPVHDAIIQNLSDTANLVSGAGTQAHAVELNIKKSSGLTDALANQAFILKVVGKDSDAYAAATKTVADRQRVFREKLLEAARTAAGPVRDKILEYIRTIDSINAKKVTEVAIAGLPVAEQDVARWLVKLGFIPKDKVTLVSVQAGEALHQLGLLKAAVAAINPNVSLVAVTRANAGGRAAGGPVEADKPYLVGEKGPEMFVPKTAGTIVPNHKMGTTETRASGGRVEPGHTYDVGEVGRERLTLFPGGGGYVVSHADVVKEERTRTIQPVLPGASVKVPANVAEPVAPSEVASPNTSVAKRSPVPVRQAPVERTEAAAYAVPVAAAPVSRPTVPAPPALGVSTATQTSAPVVKPSALSPKTTALVTQPFVADASKVKPPARGNAAEPPATKAAPSPAPRAHVKTRITSSDLGTKAVAFISRTVGRLVTRPTTPTPSAVSKIEPTKPETATPAVSPAAKPAAVEPPAPRAAGQLTSASTPAPAVSVAQPAKVIVPIETPASVRAPVPVAAVAVSKPKTFPALDISPAKAAASPAQSKLASAPLPAATTRATEFPPVVKAGEPAPTHLRSATEKAQPTSTPIAARPATAAASTTAPVSVSVPTQTVRVAAPLTVRSVSQPKTGVVATDSPADRRGQAQPKVKPAPPAAAGSKAPTAIRPTAAQTTSRALEPLTATAARTAPVPPRAAASVRPPAAANPVREPHATLTPAASQKAVPAVSQAQNVKVTGPVSVTGTSARGQVQIVPAKVMATGARGLGSPAVAKVAAPNKTQGAPIRVLVSAGAGGSVARSVNVNMKFDINVKGNVTAHPAEFGKAVHEGLHALVRSGEISREVRRAFQKP